MRTTSWRWEVPLFYLVLAGLQSSLEAAGLPFARLNPHPYWAGVLLFALRYGTRAGLAAGAASAALMLGGVWLSGERYRFEDADFYAQPLLFLAVAAALGAAADRLGSRIGALERELSLSAERADALAAELAVQQKTTRAVEQQVVSQMSSLVTLYQGSRELGHLDRKQLFDGILDFFAGALQAGKAALYRREGDRWTLYSQKGWQEGDSFPSEIGFGEGLIGRAGSEDRVVSLRDWFGGDVEKAWEGRAKADAVIAGPLHREDGEVIGVFAVQEIPFLRFNSAALNLVALLLEWADEAIAKSLYFEELKSKSILDEGLGVYNHSYFVTRAEQEFDRSKTYALPFSVLLVATPGLAAAPAASQSAYLRAVGRLLSESCRKIDVVTKFSEAEVPFSVLLMTASSEQARELRDKLLASARSLGLDKSPASAAAATLKVGVGSYASSMKSLEDLIAAARKDLR